MSLVVSARSLLKYGVIFRHLFDFKWTERCLMVAWRDLQARQQLKKGPLPFPQRVIQLNLSFVANTFCGGLLVNFRV
jgi:hypothetical protein